MAVVIGAGSFSEIWDYVKGQGEGETGTIRIDEEGTTTAAIRRHWRAHRKKATGYGVYVAFQGDAVIYIGKAGSTKPDGRLKDQGLLKRLTNRRGEGSAEVRYSEWLRRGDQPMVFEYVILFHDQAPEWTGGLLTPAFAETLLLQVYLHQHGCLPRENQEL